MLKLTHYLCKGLQSELCPQIILRANYLSIYRTSEFFSQLMLKLTHYLYKGLHSELCSQPILKLSIYLYKDLRLMLSTNTKADHISIYRVSVSGINCSMLKLTTSLSATSGLFSQPSILRTFTANLKFSSPFYYQLFNLIWRQELMKTDKL